MKNKGIAKSGSTAGVLKTPKKQGLFISPIKTPKKG